MKKLYFGEPLCYFTCEKYVSTVSQIELLRKISFCGILHIPDALCIFRTSFLYFGSEKEV